MPCIFCLAVFALFAGAITTAVLDRMEEKLASVASGPIARSVDSESVAKFDTVVNVPPVPGAAGPAGRPIPVSVTVYKKHRRVRIQVMTHDLSRSEAEAIENIVATALELTIVDRSDAHDEEKVREAFGHEAQAEPAKREEAQPATQRPQAAPPQQR